MKKPKTTRDCALYRATLSCKIGKETIDGKTVPPCGVGVFDYALYNLLSAVEDIAIALSEKETKQ